MASNKIKGLTVEIGGDTTKLGKALEGVNKQSASLGSELKDINRMLKFDPGNTELLAQKQKVLADEIETTSQKLDILKEAERQVQQQFEKGEASEEQVRELQREIIKTTQALNRYERESLDTQKALSEVGKESEDAKKEVKDLDKAFEDLNDGAGKLSDGLNKGVVVGLTAVVAGVTAAAAAIYNSVEATHEYRTAMGKLNTAFDAHNHSTEDAAKTYEALQGILGETDQAVEAANHLAVLANNEEDLEKWTRICTGVFAQFGDSLPIEGLAEAANETAKVGQVTGPLADAINWAKVSSEEWSKALDGNKAAQKAFNKAIKDGESVEDAFNAALEKVNTEQERQQLLAEALTGVYGDVADSYRETNAEVIRSNELTERFNKIWAKVGDKAAPIVNTFREGIADLAEELVDMIDDADVEEFQKTIKDGFNSLAKDVLPKLINALKWCAEHFDEIKSVAVGFITVLAVGKIGNFAVSVGTTLANAFKTLGGALKGATTAQKGMNAAAAANVYVLLAQAVIGVGAALTTYFNSQAEKAKQKARELAQEMYGLSEAEEEAVKHAKEAAEAFRNQREALDQSVEGTVSQMAYVSSLKDELFKLADATGKVKDEDKARADFILGQLNEALDTEYQRTGDQIQNYKQLAGEIENVINKKKAELLLEDATGPYVEAIKGKAKAEEDYYTNLASYTDTQAKYNAKYKEYLDMYDRLTNPNNPDRLMGTPDNVQRFSDLEQEVKVLEEQLGKTETAYNNSKEVIAGYYNDIGQYEKASVLALEGNTQEAARILADRGYYQEKYADTVGFSSDEIMNTWELEATEAGIKSSLIKSNWEKGIDGYGESMVTEAENSYQSALDAMADAYEDAEGIGGDVSEGLKVGMEGGRTGLIDKAKSLVNSIMSAFDKGFDRHSPAKETIDLGEDVGEGLNVGMDNKTKDLVKTVTAQVQKILKAQKNGAERAASDALSAAQKQLDNHKVYNNMSLAEEVRYWDELRREFKAGTQARIDADKKYFDADKKFLENDKKLKEGLIKAEEDYRKAIDATEQKIENRAKSIMNQYKIFDFAGILNQDKKVNGGDLLNNMSTQVTAMTMWGDEMAKLEEKIGGTALFDAIQELGVESLYEVQAINEMTKEQLDQYVMLYNQRADLARKQARNELKDETAAAIQDAEKTYTAKIAELGTTLQGTATSTQGALAQIANAATSTHSQIVTSAQTTMAELQALLTEAQAMVTGSTHYEQAAAGKLGNSTNVSTTAGGLSQAEMLKKLDGIYERLGRLKWITDTGVLVGELIDDIDKQLGKHQVYVARGVY